MCGRGQEFYRQGHLHISPVILERNLQQHSFFLLLNIAPVFPVCHANEIFFTIKQLKLVVPGFDLNPRGVNVALAYEDTHFWHAYYGFFVVLIIVMIITKISK